MVSIFDVVSKGDIVVGSMLDELIRAVEKNNFNPAAPILRVVDYRLMFGESDLDIVSAISAMNNARIRYEGTTCYLVDGDAFQIYAAEWYAEMHEEGEWEQAEDDREGGYRYFPDWPSGWCVSEPRNTAEVTPWLTKFGVPHSQPPLGRIGIAVRYYYLDEEDGSLHRDWDCDFAAFKYADKPDEAFKLRSEELIELNKPQFNFYGYGMYVEWSPDLTEAAVKARLLAALAAVKI